MAITKTKRPAHPQERSRGREGADERGRGADRPGEIPRKGWKDILLRVKKEQSEDNISIIAAGVAFMACSQFFPLWQHWFLFTGWSLSLPKYRDSLAL